MAATEPRQTVAIPLIRVGCLVSLHTFEEGMRETVDWYLNNREWLDAVMDESYGHTSPNSMDD